MFLSDGQNHLSINKATNIALQKECWGFLGYVIKIVRFSKKPGFTV
jgi:hypothetical protein